MWRRFLSISMLKKGLPLLLKAWPILLGILVLVGLASMWWWGRDWEVAGYRPFANIQVPLLITVALMAAIALLWGLKLRRRLAELDRDQQRAEAEQQDPILEEEARQGRTLDRLLNVLRRRFGKRQHRYRLPWYLVLGGEASGKSSLLAHSGQTFSMTDELERAHQGEPGRIALDWWVSDQGLFVDPRGELIGAASAGETMADERSDRLWHHLLLWLKTARPRRPLDGVVLTLDLSLLARESAEQRERRLQQLRARLRELMETLGSRLPVYVVLTKMDLLQGFEPFFRDLPDAERDAPLGFTFSLDAFSEPDAWLDEFEQQFEAFVAGLEARLPHVQQHCQGPEERAAAFAFPRQFRGLQGALTAGLRTLLGQDAFATPALVRGLYFTSVYQQGVPEDVFVDASARHYGLEEGERSAQYAQRSMRYFVGQLFPAIICRESGLASDSETVVRARRRRLILATAACVVAGGLITLGWHHYYRYNVEAADTVVKEVENFQRHWHGEDPALDTTGQHLLSPLEPLRRATLAFGESSPRFAGLAHMGLYQGEAVRPAVEQAYLSMLAHEFVPALMLGVTEELGRVDEADYRSELKLLRVLRMLYDDSGRDSETVIGHMESVWQEAFPGMRSVQEELRDHLAYAMAHTDLAGARDAGDPRAVATLAPFRHLISRTQQRLGDLPTAERVYEDLQQRGENELTLPMDLRQQVGPRFNLVFENRNDDSGDALSFSRMHTREGLNEVVIRRMDSVTEQALLDNWALGRRDEVDFSDSDTRHLQEQVQDHYIRDYIRTWRGALEAIDVATFEDLSHGVSVLEGLTGSSQPLVRLLKVVEANTLLYPSGGEYADMADEALRQLPQYPVARGVEQPFASLHEFMAEREEDEQSNLEELMEAVEALHDHMRSIRESSDTGKEALEAARSRLNLDGPDPILNLRRLASNSPEPVSRMLTRLADESWRVLLDAAADKLERRWHEEVVRPFQRQLAGRYPFSPGSERDAGIADFEEFFEPEGTLASFYDEQLRLFLEDSPEQLRGPDGDPLVRESVTDTLEQAERIREAFFTRSGSLDVEFTLEPVHLSGNKRRSVANVDGQMVDYSHGPRNSVPLIWPNTLRESVESRVTLIPTEVNRSPRSLIKRGPWAWFRLLDEAELTGASRGSIDVAFTIDDGKMTYRLHAADEANPFTESLLEDFSIPRRLY